MRWCIKLQHLFWSLLLSPTVFQSASITSLLTKVVSSMLIRRCTVTVSDDVLVAAAYYIGTEMDYNGASPFAILAYITTGCMISSEILAKIKKRKRRISPAMASIPDINLVKSLVISNFIPFTTLNIIFAFSIVISAIIKVFQQKQIGVPILSIQMVVMQICLLFSNSEAKKHFKRRLAAFREVDQIQTIYKDDKDVEKGI
jgi:hypothetical protein